MNKLSLYLYWGFCFSLIMFNIHISADDNDIYETYSTDKPTDSTTSYEYSTTSTDTAPESYDSTIKTTEQVIVEDDASKTKDQKDFGTYETTIKESTKGADVYETAKLQKETFNFAYSVMPTGDITDSNLYNVESQNLLNGRQALTDALGTEFISSSTLKKLDYNPLSTERTLPLYLRAMQYYQNFYKQDAKPSVIIDANNKSNSVISTIQYMIDACATNLNWLATNILDAVLDRKHPDAYAISVTIMSDDEQKSTSPTFLVEGSETQGHPAPTTSYESPKTSTPPTKTTSIRQPYIENHKKLIELGNEYETKWIKPTEKYVDLNWKSSLYDQFISRRDAIILFTSTSIIQTLTQASIARSTISDQEFSYAREIVLNTEKLLKNEMQNSTSTAADYYNILNTDSQLTLNDIWNNVHRNYALLSANNAQAILMQMTPETNLGDPQKQNFNVSAELQELIGPDNPNIQTLQRLKNILTNAARSMSCVNHYNNSIQTATSIKDCPTDMLGSDCTLMTMLNNNASTIETIMSTISELKSSPNFEDKTQWLVALNKAYLQYYDWSDNTFVIVDWLNKHLASTANFLSSIDALQQGQKEITFNKDINFPLYDSDAQTLKASVRTVQSYYERALFGFNQVITESIAPQTINGTLVPNSWVTYAQDTYPVIMGINDALKLLYAMLNDQSFDTNDMQLYWIRTLNYAVKFDNAMAQQKNNAHYARTNPLPFYDALSTSIKGTDRPLTALIAQKAITYWLGKINQLGTTTKACSDAQVKSIMNYMINAKTIDTKYYPALSDKDRKNFTMYINTCIETMLNEAQAKLKEAQKLDTQFESDKDKAINQEEYTENPQLIEAWEQAVHTAQFVLDYLLENPQEKNVKTMSTGAIKTYFDCMDSYIKSNAVRMHPDYMVRQIQLCYAAYSMAEKIKQQDRIDALKSQLKTLIQPTWDTITKALSLYQTTVKNLTTGKDYEDAINNLEALASAQTWLVKLSPLIQIDSTKSHYSIPLFSTELKPITLPESDLVGVYADLNQQYGTFIFKECLTDLWNNGSRKISNKLDQKNSPEILTEFVPIKLQKAAKAYTRAMNAYITKGSDFRKRIETINNLKDLAARIFQTEATSVEPIAPTHEFDSYIPQEMAGKVYGRYLLTSLILPIPSDVWDTYKEYDEPEILAQTLVQLFHGLSDETDIDSLTKSYKSAIRALIKTGITAQGATYKMSITTAQYGSSENSYALFIHNYPTLPVSSMNLLNTTALEAQGELGLEAYIVGLNQLKNYEDMKSFIQTDNASFKFIKEFIEARVKAIKEQCKSAYLSAAYMLYKQATYVAGTSSLTADEKQLFCAYDIKQLPKVPTTIKTLDEGEGLTSFERLQNSPLEFDPSDWSKNIFFKASFFAADAEEAPLADPYQKELSLRTTKLVQQKILQDLITFLQPYLIGDPSATNYQTVSKAMEAAFAQAANTALSTDSDKKIFTALYDQQVQRLLESARFYETDAKNKDLFIASNNLFATLNFYDQYKDKVDKKDIKMKMAKQVGIIAIYDLLQTAQEKLINWYNHRNEKQDDACASYKTDLFDAVAYFGILSEISKSDEKKDNAPKQAGCLMDLGNDRISFYYKVFGLKPWCPAPKDFAFCSRTNTKTCLEKNSNFNENTLMDNVNPDVNNYFCSYLKNTCYGDISEYIYKTFVPNQSSNDSFAKFIRGFAEQLGTKPYTLTKAADGIQINATASWSDADTTRKLSAIQRWATRMISIILGLYVQVTCSDDSDKDCRIRTAGDFQASLSSRASALKQSIAQLFRGTATVTCSSVTRI